MNTTIGSHPVPLVSSLARLLPLLLSVGLLSGCAGTFKEVKPMSTAPPPAEKPKELAVGMVQVTDTRLADPERAVMVHAFRLGVEKWCKAHKDLTYVAETNAGPVRVVLEGTIHEVEKGSKAARFWIGMGAGQERVRGEFVLRGKDGQELTRFTARKSYLGGVGAGGWDMMELQELVSELGEVTAETATKWLGGGKIQ